MTRAVEERFWSKVRKSEGNGCWEWTGAGANSALGYGFFCWRGKSRLAHRVSWILHHKKEIPDGLIVCHHCDNPSCIRPSHLFLGTQKENLADRESKGRTLKGERHWANIKPEKLARGSHHGNSHITEDDVREMRELYAQKKTSQNKLANHYKMAQASINSILIGKTWAHAGGPVTKRGRKSLTEEQAVEIKGLLAKKIPQREIIRRLGVGKGAVSDISVGKTWKHL